MTILVISVSHSKLAECVHAAFTSVEKHCAILFFAGLQFVFEKYHMQKGTPLGKTEWIFV